MGSHRVGHHLATKWQRGLKYMNWSAAYDVPGTCLSVLHRSTYEIDIATIPILQVKKLRHSYVPCALLWTLPHVTQLVHVTAKIWTSLAAESRCLGCPSEVLLWPAWNQQSNRQFPWLCFILPFQNTVSQKSLLFGTSEAFEQSNGFYKHSTQTSEYSEPWRLLNTCLLTHSCPLTHTHTHSLIPIGFVTHFPSNNKLERNKILLHADNIKKISLGAYQYETEKP